jgi:hypothetical protein
LGVLGCDGSTVRVISITAVRAAAMAFLFLFFTVALSLCVVGLIVLALASILASVRDDWKLKKTERGPRPGEY